MVVQIPYELISHTRRLSSLYKRWVRNIQNHIHERHEFRYHAVLARADFDEILKEKDMIKAKQMIEDKEEELYRTMHREPIIFPTSIGGVAYERYIPYQDWVLDYWHPLEKAIFPKYFTKREIRKRQYIEMWEKQYGPPPKVDY